MTFEIFKEFIEEIGDNPSILFRAWARGEEGVIFLTFCHFCYEKQKDTILNNWRGYKVDKIQGVYIKGMSKLCPEHS